MDDVGEWLLMEVLLRLPLVSLYKFKVVCKKWLALISTPYFLGEYASRGWISPRWVFVSRKPYCCSEPQAHHELLMDLQSGDIKCPIPNPSNEAVLASNYRILGVSNGLVLYTWWNQEHGCTDHNWGVCNPVTRQCVVLPPCISKHDYRDGFGFLTQMEGGVVTSFTVVKYGARPSRFEVFSSETGEWKLSHVFNVHTFLYSTPTDVGGILHWIVNTFTSGIVAYDPSGTARFISLPADRRDGRIGLCGTHDGRLRYLECAPQGLRAWVLDDYGCGDNWSLIHRASHTDILKHVRLERERLRDKIQLQPISFHPFDPDVVYLGCAHVFLSYNMREGKSRLLKAFKARGNGVRDYKWRRAICLVIPPLPLAIPSVVSEGMH